MLHLSCYAQLLTRLSSRMEKRIISYVQSKGGFIDLRNADMSRSDIYGFTCDTMDGDNMEFPIIAIKVKHDCAHILFNRYLGDAFYEMSDDDFKHYCLDVCDNFVNLSDSYVLSLPTLFSLCKHLEEY